MKSLIYRSSWLLVTMACLVAIQASAQSFTNFYSFQAASTNQEVMWTNQLGATPSGPLLLLGNKLYGATGQGGTNGSGVIYSVTTNGTSYTVLHVFSALKVNKSGVGTNLDGASPAGGLVVSGTTLYGVTARGGTNGGGTIFSIITNGSSFTDLHSFSAGATNTSLDIFTNKEGANPFNGLALFGTTLFGTTFNGGLHGNGGVFHVTTTGASFTNFYSFSAMVASNNTDGANPYGTPLLMGDRVYGTTENGGTNGTGTIFAVLTNGTSFTDLHSFANIAVWNSGPYANIYTNADGANSRATLILVGSTLYGSATFGGLFGYGTLYSMETDGLGFTNVHQFAEGGLSLTDFAITNTDGIWPQAGVTVSGNALYGTCEYGGLGLGSVFSVTTNGNDFTVLHYFPAGSTLTIFPNGTNSDGAYPQTQMLLANGFLYSSAAYGGLFGSGTLFGVPASGVVLPAPVLMITQQNTNALLTWSANSTGYTLQFTTNLEPAAWFNVSPSPSIIGGYYVVTNSITGTNRFFRLEQ
jgi:uncharacterized repeat protein (TIGR03803 family)